MTTENFKAMQSKTSFIFTFYRPTLHLNFQTSVFLFQIRSIGIEFTASAMDLTSVNFLHSINVPFIKVMNQYNEDFTDDEYKELKLFQSYSGWLRRREPFSVT